MITDLGKVLIGKGVTLPDRLLQKYLQWRYIRKTLEYLKINCVLDVGANKGQFATSLRKVGYSGRIISFEPIRKDFETLSQTLAADQNWQGFNLALGNENGPKTFNISTKETQLSSFLNLKAEGWGIESHTVEMQQLDRLFPELIAKIPNPRVFLKMDTQGYDMEVVKGAQDSISQVLGLISELAVRPAYDNMPSYLESLRCYEELGFRLVDLGVAARDGKTSEMVEYDCIMVRAGA
ncbi:MAG: FkbM family methyltransferase [Spirulinaceae cyanobacterium]